jgi:hypothetical protein
VIEERIRSDLYFVKLNISLPALQTNRLRVADEMNIVSAGGEFHSELGGDDSRAAVRWVACDPDAHMVGLCRFVQS